MPNNIPYLEMNGLGNKFIMINQEDIDDKIDLSDLAKSLAKSIEFDQMILYKLSKEYTEMFVYNKDGSEAGMCGNAARCIMKIMHDKRNQMNIQLKVGDKQLECSYKSDAEITIAMGEVNFEPDWRPKNLEKAKELLAKLNVEYQHICIADVGNPHIIILLQNPLTKVTMEVIGEAFQTDDYFPGGINVNFAVIKDSKINLTVYERGAGFTEACGSGATATYAALFKENFIKGPSLVHFLKGDLLLSYTESGISLTGAAEGANKAEFHYSASLESFDA